MNFIIKVIPVLILTMLASSSYARTKTDRYKASKDKYELSLNNGWMICSSEKAGEDGAAISTHKYPVKDWFTASVPSTVLGTLVNDGIFKNIFMGENLKNIPAKQFDVPWWYRTEFNIPKEADGKFIKLKFEGINYSADIWLNGKLVASKDSIKGAFRMFEINVTNFIKPGKTNALAIEVCPPKTGDPTIGFVDWNPESPDKNMGVWRPVKLKISGDVSIDFPFVQSKINLKTLQSADLTVSAELTNNSNHKVSGILSGKIGEIRFSEEVTLKPTEKKLVPFSSQEFDQLKIHNPRLWWTYNLGKPFLYNLELTFRINGKLSDISETKFGIREVSDYINKEGLPAESRLCREQAVWRGYKLNGKKILVLGGGWADDIFLNNNYENIKNQIEYVKSMGLNAIRLEGFWGTSSDLYNLCDENGILIMAGWSCQWEWKEYIGKPDDEYGSIKSPEDMELVSKSWEDQIKWLRNHPSIFVWLYGSDRIPRPELEKKYLEILCKDDPARPFLASSENTTSSLTGRAAMKHGPYDYVPPVYWWIDKKAGGASAGRFGFNTEVGSGAEVPPLESIKKMIPKKDLWPVDSVWNFHCAKNLFGNLNSYIKAIDNRLGNIQDLNDFSRKSQFINYENTRAMFEANEADKYKATGLIHWMLNAAWPKLWWQLYDYYLMPGGAFYGVKKACEPVHVLYNYGDSSIVVVNNTYSRQNGLTAKVRILNFDLAVKYSKSFSLNLYPDTAISILKLPRIDGLSKTYFLVLKLFSGGRTVSTNFYCLSTKPDLLDTAKTNWFITPTKQYAGLEELSNLNKVHLKINSKFFNSSNREEVEVELTNDTGRLAFQIVLDVYGKQSGNSVLPIFWGDNYFSLLPGEKRTIKGHFDRKYLNGEEPALKVSGWNLN